MMGRKKTTSDHEEFLDEYKEVVDESVVKAKGILDKFEGTFVVIGLDYDENHNVTGVTKLAAIIGEPSDLIDISRALHSASHDIIEETLKELPERERTRMLLALAAEALRKTK